METENIQSAYRLASQVPATGDGRDIRAILNFKKILQSHLDPEFDEVHYEFLRNRSSVHLYHLTRAEFAKRPNAERFLLSKLPAENDTDMQADILQILGHLRSSHAALIARTFLRHDSVRHREVALFVLGWVGDQPDIPTLNDYLVKEPEPRLRITAASALRQMAFRLPKLKDDILRCLKIGFEQETSDEVIPWLIIMVASVAGRNLGIRESKKDPDKWSGDLQKARQRTATFLHRKA